MTNKDALAILGTLITQGNSYTKTDSLIATLANDGSLSLRIVNYLTKLKLEYDFVNEIVTGEYGSVFYHNVFAFYSELPKKYNKKELRTSEYDFVEIDEETGRVGIWCEFDGFIAWLDKYQKVWTVDTREEIEERRKEQQKWIAENISPVAKRCVEKAFKTEEEPAKLNKIKLNGLNKYKPIKKVKKELL